MPASIGSASPLIFVLPMPAGGTMLELPTLGITCLGASFFCVATSFLMMSMARERAERGQRRAAETDALTGIANRRAFVAKAEQECQATGRSLALLMFDIDHFKAINDTYGHGVGDEVLIAFSRAAAAKLPQHATFGRFGGEEFACVIEECDPSEAVRIAEALRQGTMTIVVPQHRDLTVRVSIGIALKPKGKPASITTLLRKADDALYRAKHAGRNRVELDENVALDQAV